MKLKIRGRGRGGKRKTKQIEVEANSKYEWSPEEDLILLDYGKKYYHNWRKFSRMIPPKTPIQCSYRYKKLLRIKNMDVNLIFTRNEDVEIYELIKTYGEDWDKIAEMFPKYTKQQLQERYYQKVVPSYQKQLEKKKNKCDINLGEDPQIHLNSSKSKRKNVLLRLRKKAFTKYKNRNKIKMNIDNLVINKKLFSNSNLIIQMVYSFSFYSSKQINQPHLTIINDNKYHPYHCHFQYKYLKNFIRFAETIIPNISSKLFVILQQIDALHLMFTSIMNYINYKIPSNSWMDISNNIDSNKLFLFVDYRNIYTKFHYIKAKVINKIFGLINQIQQNKNMLRDINGNQGEYIDMDYSGNIKKNYNKIISLLKYLINMDRKVVSIQRKLNSQE